MTARTRLLIGKDARARLAARCFRQRLAWTAAAHVALVLLLLIRYTSP